MQFFHIPILIFINYDKMGTQHFNKKEKRTTVRMLSFFRISNSQILRYENIVIDDPIFLIFFDYLGNNYGMWRSTFNDNQKKVKAQKLRSKCRIQKILVFKNFQLPKNKNVFNIMNWGFGGMAKPDSQQLKASLSNFNSATGSW